MTSDIQGPRSDLSHRRPLWWESRIHGTTLQEYWIEFGAAPDFLERKHPAAKNIRKNDGEGDFVVIGAFDDEVFQVLSEMVGDPTYWRLNCEYKRVP